MGGDGEALRHRGLRSFLATREINSMPRWRVWTCEPTMEVCTRL